MDVIAGYKTVELFNEFLLKLSSSFLSCKICIISVIGCSEKYINVLVSFLTIVSLEESLL